MLGGSSSINAMMWVRGYAADYDRWAELAGAGWGYRQLQPYFARIDQTMHIEPQRSPRRHTARFLAATDELGLPRAEPNSAQPDGFVQTLVTQHRGRRFSAADGYLKPVRHRSNLTVLTGAQATRVLFEAPATGRAELPQSNMSAAVYVTRCGSPRR
ncbi:hypothetical protein GCM10027052_03170 [Parafrigoribacterium mesophilum]|uniref:GMC family oxidoreductase N-terminal domain-containing protein n=1 Tax=Parafrigoribacterium mesophilum TaxID=433646 RepID=UPI0031FCE06D